MGENIKNGRRYLILGQNSISSPIFNILPHYEKLGVKFKMGGDTLLKSKFNKILIENTCNPIGNSFIMIN
jgi:hypothetical protein